MNARLSGTAGQHDASGSMTGGDFSLTGGFWSFYTVHTAGAPWLSIKLTSTNTATAGHCFQAGLFFRHPGRLLLYLAWLNLLWVFPMLARWRVVAGGRWRRDAGR